MANRVKFGGVEARSIFSKIVESGARKDLRIGVARDVAIEIGLAEEAAIDRVGQIALIGKFARVHDS